MSESRLVRNSLIAGVTMLVTACASREVPAQYPKAVAASPDASAAKPALVTQTLAPAAPIAGGKPSSSPSAPAQAGHQGRAAQLPATPEGPVELESTAEGLALLKRPLDADGAVRLALLNNRELRAQLRELGVRAGDVVTAGLVANPTLEFELLPERDSRYELRVEYDLTSLLMAPLRRSAAEADLEAARLAAASAVLQLGYDVRSRFYALQAAQQRLELEQQSLEALAAARDAIQALVDAGNVRQLDAAAGIAAHERARVRVASLELEVAERREEVQRLLGLYGEQTEWQMAGGLPDAPDASAPTDGLERAALEANLDLRATHKRLDALAKQTGVVRTEGWLPEVAADVHALRVKAEPGGAGDEWNWGAGVSLRIPVFDRGQGRLRSVESQFDAALERYQGMAIEVRSAARDARNRAVSTFARARQYQTVIRPAQRAVLEQTLLQYNAMQIGVFELLVARRELLDVELAYVDTLREFWTAQAELEVLRRGRFVRAGESPRIASLDTSAERQGGH